MHKIIFFGSSPFSVVVLEKLVTSNQLSVVSVVTNEDKPVGRHLKLTPNPVKFFAIENNIPVYTSPLQLPSPNLGEGSGGEVLGVVAAFGQILSQEILDKFGGQMYNIHPSLLPKYRGASPLQQQILDGVVDTGVTIIKMDTLMDHGPIVAVAYDKILPEDTTVTLGNRLFEMGAELVISNQLSVISEQDHSQATYTKKLTRESGFITFEQFENYLKNKNLKLKISRMQRAFAPWPGVWTINPKGERVILKP